MTAWVTDIYHDQDRYRPPGEPDSIGDVYAVEIVVHAKTFNEPPQELDPADCAINLPAQAREALRRWLSDGEPAATNTPYAPDPAVVDTLAETLCRYAHPTRWEYRATSTPCSECTVLYASTVARLVAEAEQRGAAAVRERVEVALRDFAWRGTSGRWLVSPVTVRAALADEGDVS